MRVRGLSVFKFKLDKKIKKYKIEVENEKLCNLNTFV